MGETLYGDQGDVPFVVDSDTSAAAAAAVTDEDLNRLEQLVYETIAATPRTCDEVEGITGLAHQTASARIRGLVLRDQIIDSGERRKTRRNRMAVVWRLRRAADDDAETPPPPPPPVVTRARAPVVMPRKR